jgi:hypothetical protein
MKSEHLLGIVLSVVIALPCIWHGQRSVNPQAQLLLVPADLQP